MCFPEKCFGEMCFRKNVLRGNSPRGNVTRRNENMRNCTILNKRHPFLQWQWGIELVLITIKIQKGS
jgi:hypothetical protein